MADDFLKVKKGLNVKPQSGSITGAQNGDIFYEAGRTSPTVIHAGAAMDLSSAATFAAVANMTSVQFNPTVLRSNTVILTGTTAGQILGMAAMPAGRQIVLLNVTNQVQTIIHESGAEGTPSHRIVTPGGINVPIVSGGAITIARDSVADRWRVVFPTTPAVQKDSGVFTWNLNGLSSPGFSVFTPFDGIRSIPVDKAVTLYAYSVSAENILSGGTTAIFTIDFWNGAVWSTLYSPTLSNGTNLWVHSAQFATNLAANASGAGPDGRGVMFRVTWNPASTGLTGVPNDFTVKLYWREQ